MTLRNPSAVASPTLIVPPVSVGFAAAVWTVNAARFMRFQLSAAGTFRYINWTCAVQSGNVQVGVVALSGAGHTTYTPVVSTGVIACPAAADIRSDVGATLLQPGDYALYFWADNATVQVPKSGSAIASLKGTANALSLTSGVITSGTLTYSTTAVALSLEADV